MGTKKIVFTSLGVIITTILILGIIEVFTTLFPKPLLIEPKTGEIECYRAAMQSIINEAKISEYSFHTEKVRCLHEGDYYEYEISGNYYNYSKEPPEKNTVYFQKIVGGMAASGADGYYETCLIINNKTVISKIETGREIKYKRPARCVWQEKLHYNWWA